MHRIASALLVVALGATALGGLALSTAPRPEPRADAGPTATVADVGRSEAAAWPRTAPTPAPAPDAGRVDLSAGWRGPVNGVLAGIVADFPDDVAGAWLEGDVATVAFSGPALPEVVERLGALGRPFAVQEGLGIASSEAYRVLSAVTDRVQALAPGYAHAAGVDVRARALVVDVGAPPVDAADDERDLGMDAHEFADRIRAGIPAADLGGFDIVVTIDPRVSFRSVPLAG
ncbi:hypothetical protein [Clavibacter michiganensis]|uniref:hypothetical protein n=1 Tax=Clavibacter michiganensis TaxID=28447 RepID=UPI0015E3DB60|nr:hypothetical protein [Clavibacter michiganensis]